MKIRQFGFMKFECHFELNLKSREYIFYTTHWSKKDSDSTSAGTSISTESSTTSTKVSEPAVDESKYYKLIIKPVFIGKSSIRFKWSRFGYNSGPGITLSWYRALTKIHTKDGQINVSDYSSEVAVNGLQSNTQYTFVIEEIIKLGINGYLLD